MSKQTTKRPPLNERKLAFIDSETTGLSADKHEIIEIAALIYDPASGEVEKEWSTKVAPSHIETANEKALQINGYINNPSAYSGKLKSALIKFNSMTQDCIIVGQNVSFDLSFIYKAMKELDIKPLFDRRFLDLMSLVWFQVKDSDIPNLKLESLCDYFGACNVGAHTALVDCRRTYEVYRKLEKIYKS